MQAQKIAIIGLGRIGTAFLTKMLLQKENGIQIVCVAENNDTSGKRLARDAGIPIKSTDEIIALGEELDVIFDLTGLPEVRRNIRGKLADAANRHTVIASESIVRIIWALITDDALPVIEGRKTGY